MVVIIVLLFFQMYSGYYKHQIESNLVGAEIMFEAMGFKHDANGVLTLDGPICPDRLISVSLDSIIAYVECQVSLGMYRMVKFLFYSIQGVKAWTTLLLLELECYFNGERSAKLRAYNESVEKAIEHRRIFVSFQKKGKIV